MSAVFDDYLAETDDEGEPAPDGDAPLTSLPQFPHERTVKLWNARIEYAHEATEKNRTTYAAARKWFAGDQWGYDGADQVVSRQLRVAVNTWNRNVTLLISFLSSNDPRVLVSPVKGPEFDATAKAHEKSAQYTFREQRFREEIKKALVEALLRNRSHVFFGWDSEKWLPTLRWCSDEVYLDPDAGGDTKNANWIAERYVPALDDILDDPEVEQSIKDELRENKGLHLAARSGAEDAGDVQTSDDDRKAWDGQPGFTKVVAYKVYSREGMLPGRAPTSDGYGPEPTDPAWLEQYRGGGNRPDTEAPEQSYGAQSEIDKIGKRVVITLVKGFNKVVKVAPWPQDFFDRDEFPIIRLQFVFLPDNADGVPQFDVLSPLLKAKNGILSFAFMDARFAAQRRVGINKSIVREASDQEKIVSGNHLEFFLQDGPGEAVTVAEFTAKNPQHLTLLPEIDKLIDEISGVNDAIRGQTGGIEKTKAEAMMLHDSATAALSYLIGPLDTFVETIARYTVMSQQRYVKRMTMWEPCPKCSLICPACGGDGCDECCDLGRIRGTGVIFGMGNGMMPMPTTCPECGPPQPAAPSPTDPTQPPPPMTPGTGWAKDAQSKPPLKKGADYWLSEKDAAAWRDDVSLDQIRAEVSVGIEPGSTRRDYRERRVGLLNQLRDRFGPQYQELGFLRSLRILDREIALATELPNAEMFLPTDEEFAAAEQRLEQARQAAMAPPPGPPPEEMQAQQVAAEQEQQRVAQEQALKVQETQHRMALEERKLALESERAAAEMQAKREAAEREHVKSVSVETAQAESEKERIALEARRVALEEAAAMEAQKQMEALTAQQSALLNELAERERNNAALLAQSLAQMGQVATQLNAAAQSMAATLKAVTDAAEQTKASQEATAAEVGGLKAVLVAPVKVERDASGKITGARREAAA